MTPTSRPRQCARCLSHDIIAGMARRAAAQHDEGPPEWHSGYQAGYREAAEAWVPRQLDTPDDFQREARRGDLLLDTHSRPFRVAATTAGGVCTVSGGRQQDAEYPALLFPVGEVTAVWRESRERVADG